MIRSHVEGIVAWTQTRQTNGFLEAINGLFRPPSARRVAIAAFQPFAPSSFPLPASSISRKSTLMPLNPLEIQQSQKSRNEAFHSECGGGDSLLNRRNLSSSP